MPLAARAGVIRQRRVSSQYLSQVRSAPDLLQSV